jgi:hypothetical protein
MIDFKDPLANLTRNQLHLLSFLEIQHRHFLIDKHKPSDYKIARVMISYCGKNPDNYDTKEISFLLSAIKLQINQFNVDVLVSFYRRRRDNLLPYFNF